MDARLRTIGRIRFDSSSRRAHDGAVPRGVERPEVAPTVSLLQTPVGRLAEARSAPPVPIGIQQAAGRTAPTPIPSTAGGPPEVGASSSHRPTLERRQRASSVQLVLLSIGVVLLSVGAIFFLVYAFINFGIVWRSIIIAGVTAAAVATSTVLRRRRLVATAEGIAGFAVVLVYLDAFAVRANDLLGTGSMDGALFWGITLVLAAIAFIVWHRATGLRVPNVVGYGTFALGVGAVVASETDRLDWSAGTLFTLAATAAAGLVPLLAGSSRAAREGSAHRTERSIVLGTAAAALTAATIPGMAVEISSGDATGAILALLLIAAVACAYVSAMLIAPAGTGATWWGAGFGVVAGWSLALLGFAFVLHAGTGSAIVIVPALTAVTISLLLESVLRRMLRPVLRASLRAAAWAATGVSVIALLLPSADAILAAGTVLERSLLHAWTAGPADRLLSETETVSLSILALTATVVLAWAAWSAERVLASRAGLLAWFGAVVLLLAPPLLGVAWAVLAGWLVLSAGALAVLVSSRLSGRSHRALRGPLLALAGAGALLGWGAGWASTSTWAVAALTAILLALVFRAVVARPAARAAALGVASTLVVVAASTTARRLTLDSAATGSDPADQLRFAAIAAVGLLIAAAVATRRLVTGLDRRVVFWISLVSALGAEGLLRTGVVGTASLLPEYGTTLAVGALLVVAVLLWMIRRGTADLSVERIAASVAAGPAVYLAVDAFVLALDAPDLTRSLAPMGAALLVSAGSLAAALMRPARVPRIAREVGVALVAMPALIRAVVEQNNTTWLVLLLAAICALLLAIDGSGPFSSSPRRHLGWLAAALGAAGLWGRLADRSVFDVEAYVLPLAGVLLLFALAIARVAAGRFRSATPGDETVAPQSADPEARDEGPRRAAPAIALAGLLVAVLPIGSAAAVGDPLRALVVASASAGLLLAGSFVRRTGNLGPYLDSAALAGSIGLIVTCVSRAAVTVADGPRNFELDAALGAGLVVLLIAGFGIARPGMDRNGSTTGDDVAARAVRLRRIAAMSLAIIGLTAVVVLESLAISEGARGLVRTVLVTLTFCAIHLLAFLVDRVPLDRTISWIALAYAGVTVAVGIGSGSLDPVEAGTVPVAVALIATGTTHLASTPSARSWPWLGPGVAVLLLPSLIATLDDRPVWRLVAIGVAGVAAIVIGVTRRLQAPFVIGSAVVLVHALATFAPQIRAVYESVEWWLWLALGGVLLIVLAARYERRIRNLRNVVARIASLR